MSEKEKESKTKSSPTPKNKNVPIGDIPTPKSENVPAQDVKTPAATGAVEGEFKKLKDDLGETRNFMYLVVVVLFVGFFILGFMLATILIQWWTYTGGIQMTLTQAINANTKAIDQSNSNTDKINEIDSILKAIQATNTGHIKQ
jgi:hypothetical protein